MASQKSLHYVCTEQSIIDNGKPRKAYRFEVLDAASGRRVYVVNDICSKKRDARALEKLFRRNKVSLVHVTDVLEDWLVGRWG